MERPAAGDPTKEMLESVVMMVCSKSTWQTLMSPDVSGLHCECFLAPFSPEDFATGVTVEEIHHKPMAIFSDQFKDAQHQWPR